MIARGTLALDKTRATLPPPRDQLRTEPRRAFMQSKRAG